MKLPEEIGYIFAGLESRGHEAFIVGGCVRDIIMGKTPHDYDITTSAKTDEIIAAFQKHHIITNGLKHGTVTVVINKKPYEITTYRADGQYSDNRHPENVFFVTSIEEDLKRRDFTVNSMAYNPKRGIVDLYGGVRDIENKLIRCVGSPDIRFNEDGLRIMRALRFASVLDFEIEEETALSVKRNKELLKNISVERIYSELIKTVMGNPDKVLNEFREVFEYILPGISINGNIDSSAPDKCVRLALLSENGGISLKKLKADNNTGNTVREILAFFENEISDPAILRLTAGKLKYASFAQIEGFSASCVRFSKYYPFVSGEFKKITGDGECISEKQLAVRGNDVIALGISPEETGRYLKAILVKVIKKELPNDAERILNYLRQIKNL